MLAAVHALLTPELTVRPRPADPESARYVRSFLVLRMTVGILGAVLPVLLVAIDRLAFDGDPFPRDSLSAYYYSGVRELFVGILFATGVFLVTYKVTERTLDNTLSILAGAAALFVAGFPTDRPSEAVALTPLQHDLGEATVQTIHYSAAGTFIVALAGISILFGVREGRRPARPGKRPPAFWRRFHWVCAALILVAVAFMAVTQIFGGPRTALLIGETASAWAFGASWLAKGAELDVLRR